MEWKMELVEFTALKLAKVMHFFQSMFWLHGLTIKGNHL